MGSTIRWGNDILDLAIRTSEEAPAFLAGISVSPDRAGAAPIDRVQPLVEVLVLGDGHSLSNTRFSHTGVGSRLRYLSHETGEEGGRSMLRVVQADSQTGLQVASVFRIWAGVPAIQTWTEVVNTGSSAVTLQMVSSLASGAFLGDGEGMADVSLLRGRSEWCGEGRWAWTPLYGPDGLPEINTTLHDHDARGTLTTVSKTTWSSGEYLPTGFLVNTRTGRSWAWQVEHNGAWRWEVDGRREGENAVALIVAGPNDMDHQWDTALAPGDEFVSVPVSLAVSDDGYEGALAALTAQRRAIRRRSEPDAGLPVIFNDYMNTLMGDPTTQKLLPLIDAAAASGAEYFCVDAGWYDDNGHWWPSVGEWKPSTSRFPDGGLERVLDHIRSRGMKPGLWLEPEVVGVLSPMADRLPDEAFLQRYGQRVVEHDRYHLDFRHPAVVEHLDAVVAHLVDDLGVRYFKLDYNVTPGPGTDLDVLSAGEGLLAHNRAHLAWLDGMVERHPHVVFENCASGAMRMDYAMMSRLDLQSTSDQQDFRLYATIAAAAPVSLLPEQAGNWAYPQPGMSDEEIAFTMVNGLVGRLYLSGHLDGMDEHEAALVAEGVDAYKALRSQLTTAEPFWPLGLPNWYDDVIALGFRSGGGSYLAVWYRGDRPEGIALDLPPFGGARLDIETIYPRSLPSWGSEWDAATARLTLTPVGSGPTARIFRLATAERPASA
ncbi:glycoside hydrolase family 36 protein [Compostimonas suwonensis]|uniref:Alpha-galactosidase n=1 Tax=Compostimonas suwonensis TaxID=1048394 RepID=A0A2M9BCE3_9MICO|nr:glycoside hydrolase family 36 protein [Compostimonas suwonensis]PJJ55582.1 alpha-galactosidase [Compostimonas suwonensis]